LGPAFAVGLWHLLSDTKSEPDIAISAQLSEKEKGKLEPVVDGSIIAKLEAARRSHEPKINKVIIAKTQDVPGGGYEDLIARATHIADPERHGSRARNVASQP
jgi:hypothetical protein